MCMHTQLEGKSVIWQGAQNVTYSRCHNTHIILNRIVPLEFAINSSLCCVISPFKVSVSYHMFIGLPFFCSNVGRSRDWMKGWLLMWQSPFLLWEMRYLMGDCLARCFEFCACLKCWRRHFNALFKRPEKRLVSLGRRQVRCFYPKTPISRDLRKFT